MNDALLKQLKSILDPDGLLTDPASMFVYSYDGAVDKTLPGAVALPRSAEQVAAVVKAAHDAGVPFVARGAGTNLCGGAIPKENGVVIHLARLNKIISIDKERRRAWVEPGVINLHLQKELAPLGLFYAPDPASQKASTLGGNVGTNAGGPHCLKYGVTTHHVTGLEVVLPDGEMVKVSIDDPGPDLTGLFVGSEGTLGIVTKIEVKLLPVPEDVQTLLVSFFMMEAAVQTVTDIVTAGIIPTTLEIMDRTTIAAVEAFVHAGYPLDAEAVLLIEVDGDKAATARAVEKIREICRKNDCGEIRQAKDEAEREKLWEGRRGSYPAMARLGPNVLVEDGVVPRQLLPEAVRRIRAIAAREKLRMGLIAHAGDGNLHPNIVFDERDVEETRRVKAAGYEMLKVCVDLGGSISGEHGIGIDKREAMRWLFTPSTLHFFRGLKRAFDPDNFCNPEKLIPDAKGEKSVPWKSGPLPERGGLRPVKLDDLRDILFTAEKQKRPLYVQGVGTKKLLVPEGAFTLKTDALTRVVDHDRSNFTLTVEAGASPVELAAVLKSAGQYLHLGGHGSLGGILSTRSSRAPSLRDQVIGLKVVLPGGELLDLGAKVMKNVAGYDAQKLFLGAWGTLGVIVQVTLRLWPFPADKLELDPHPRPFVPTELHRRVKAVCDPGNILNPTIFA